jgi:hypothetical protein
LLVVADDGVREAGRVVARNLGPHVVDRGGEALVREEPHPVAGEPEENVVRGGAQVVVDLVLERAVVDSVHRRIEACRCLEGGIDGHDALEVGLASEWLLPSVTLPVSWPLGVAQ